MFTNTCQNGRIISKRALCKLLKPYTISGIHQNAMGSLSLRACKGDQLAWYGKQPLNDFMWGLKKLSEG